MQRMEPLSLFLKKEGLSVARRMLGGSSAALADWCLHASVGAPAIAVIADPVQQRMFKSHVMTGLFRLKPFVTKDLFTFGQEFLIEAGSLHQIPATHWGSPLWGVH